MIAEQLRAAIQASPRAELPTVSGLLWKAFAANQISEEEASELAEMIQLKRAIPAPQSPPSPRLGSRPRTPAHLERRRSWAASGLLPPRLAQRFTPGESAVLCCIAKESRARGDCRLSHQEVADVVGCSVTLVKTALRAARTLGLLSIEERRVHAFRNRPSVVRITSSEWRSWLKLGGGGRSGPRSPTYSEKRVTCSPGLKPGASLGDTSGLLGLLPLAGPFRKDSLGRLGGQCPGLKNVLGCVVVR
jgi:hypothetical protein